MLLYLFLILQLELEFINNYVIKIIRKLKKFPQDDELGIQLFYIELLYWNTEQL